MTVKRALLVTLVAVGLPFFSNCTDEDATRDTLRKAGYKNIQITGYKPFQCGEDDRYSTGFTAINSNGETVEGTVCCGLWTKGCTVRF